MRKALHFLLIFLILSIACSCATTTEITSSRGTIRIGMTKSEVLSFWGEPRQRTPPAEPSSINYDENRYEFFIYPSSGMFGNSVIIAFNKNGIVTDIETLYK